MKIDTHLHVWKKKEPPYMWMLDRIDGQFDVLEWCMEQSGVDRAVFVGSIKEQNEDNNEYLSEIIHRYPGKFQAWGSVNIRHEDAIDRMKHCIDELGLVGINFYMPAGGDFEFMLGDSLHGLWKGLVERKGSFNTACSYSEADIIGRLADRYPELNIILAHMGRPIVEEPEPYQNWGRILELAQYGNIYVKLSGIYSFSEKGWGVIEYPYTEVYPLVRSLRDSFGAERLTWGSDFSPCLQHHTYQQAVNFIDKGCTFLSQDEKEWIFGKTIEKIVKF